MQGNCRVILRNRFEIITTMIVQNTIFTTNFVPIQRFHDWIFPLGDAAKKKLLNRLAGDSAGQIQSYPSNDQFIIITAMIVQNTIFTT